MRLQIRKHNGRYLKGISILRSVFDEQQTGVLFGKLIKGQDPSQNELDYSYVSKIHKMAIDLNHLYSFLKKKVTIDEINSIKASMAYLYHQQHVQSVIDGTNIWDKEDADESLLIRCIVLTKYGAHQSTQHNNKILVKISSRMARTRKNE